MTTINHDGHTYTLKQDAYLSASTLAQEIEGELWEAAVVREDGAEGTIYWVGTPTADANEPSDYMDWNKVWQIDLV